MIKPKSQLKVVMQTGDRLEASNLADLIESFAHREGAGTRLQLYMNISGGAPGAWDKIGAYLWTDNMDDKPTEIVWLAETSSNLDLRLIDSSSQVLAQVNGIADPVPTIARSVFSGPPQEEVITIEAQGSGSFTLYSITHL